ncbi:MAG: transcription antitermination factor NusB [Phycisphaerae bacterium]|nr:transcription antitermination factor NusB [Phycisphaerae bacterium]
MSAKRRQARILAVQGLFQLDAQGDDLLGQIPGFLADSGDEIGVTEYAAHLIRGAWARHPRIDDLVGKVSEHWAVNRMPPVDRSIIRMAVFEMMDPGGPPAPVVIDEAVELARIFGGAESPHFVNGVLDAVRKRLADDASMASD